MKRAATDDAKFSYKDNLNVLITNVKMFYFAEENRPVFKHLHPGYRTEIMSSF